MTNLEKILRKSADLISFLPAGSIFNYNEDDSSDYGLFLQCTDNYGYPRLSVYVYPDKYFYIIDTHCLSPSRIDTYKGSVDSFEEMLTTIKEYEKLV